MQCRVIARRCPLGSVTVLGDLAQATTPWAPGDWTVTLRHLGHEGAPVRPLTAGYRVPGEVLDLANRLLPYVAVNVPPATSIRQGADALRIDAGGTLAAAVAACLRLEGSVGVLVPDARLEAARAELGDQPDRVEIVAASAAKGLEFDSVVVLEPADIVDAEPSRVDGLRRLYVVLTRAVSRLHVLHDRPLPPELTGQAAQDG